MIRLKSIERPARYRFRLGESDFSHSVRGLLRQAKHFSLPAFLFCFGKRNADLVFSFGKRNAEVIVMSLSRSIQFVFKKYMSLKFKCFPFSSFLRFLRESNFSSSSKKLETTEVLFPAFSSFGRNGVKKSVSERRKESIPFKHDIFHKLLELVKSSYN